jgi:hypothetical protein
LDQGTEALTRSAAAHGGVGGGGFAKDLNNYVQGSASQEYQKAFDRFETSTQNRFANVNAVSNSGRDAATKQGQYLTDAAQYGGNAMIDAAKFGTTAKVGASEFGGNITTDASKFAGSANIDATNLTSKNILDAAAGKANYDTSAAAALAGGKVAASNAMWGGFSGAANSALSTVLATRPAVNYINPWGGLGPGQLPPAPNSQGVYPQ